MKPSGAAVLAVALSTAIADAQPVNTPDQSVRSLGAYVYMMDGSSNKVLVTTQFFRNDPKYDDRAFHRYLDVVSALEKRVFKKDERATIESWDKPEKYARCYIYLEDLQAGRKTKTGMTSGTRLWCTNNGISELELNQSDNPKHVDQALHQFDAFLDRAKVNLRK
jgi:hypothetical protein